MLGKQQLKWFTKTLAGSQAKWRIIGNQVIFAGLDQRDIFPEKPRNMDAWDGYPAARARVYEGALNADANLISLAGDTHNAWAFELAHEDAPVGVEFGGHSVTSPGFENFLGGADERLVTGALVQENEQLTWANTAKRGYMVVELTPERATSEYRFLDGVRQRGTVLSGTQRLTSEAGSHSLSAT